MSLRKIAAISALLIFSSQFAWANYAFYRQIVNTCKLYRMPVDEKKMVLTKNDDGSYVSVSSLGNFFVTLGPEDQTWQPHQRASSKRVQTLGFKPDGQLWMLSRGAEIRLNDQVGDYESWSKAIIPLVNGYNYMDMAWDPNGGIWAGGGNGTLLVSKDEGKSWEKDPIGYATPTNFIRILFLENVQSNSPKGFALGERGHVLRWVANS